MFIVQDVVGRKGRNLPAPGNAGVAQHYRNIQVVALDILVNFRCRIPIERHRDDFNITRVTPATQPIQVAGTCRTDSAPWCEEVHQCRSCTGAFQGIEFAVECCAR